MAINTLVKAARPESQISKLKIDRFFANLFENLIKNII